MSGYHRSVIRLFDEKFDGSERCYTLHAFVIGYVVSGLKRMYENGVCTASFIQGDMFCIGPGEHHMEHRRTAERPYEEIIFMYDIGELQHTASHLSVIRRFSPEELPYGESSGCCHCGERAPSMIRSFFTAAARCFESGKGLSEEEMLFRKEELVMMIMAYGSAEVCRFMLRHTECSPSAMFEQIVYGSIFSKRPLNAIAHMCDRSLSAFKTEFKRRFGCTPHRWFVEQRLNRALVLLRSSAIPVSEVSAQCMFPNTSYFIKIFRKHYGITPSAYRRRSMASAEITAAAADTKRPAEAAGTEAAFFK